MTSPIRLRAVALVALAVASAVGLAGCIGASSSTAVGEPRVSGDSWADSTTGTPAGPGSCELDRHEGGLLPDAACTPGAITTEISPAETSSVCTKTENGDVEESVRAAVLGAYGIVGDDQADYSVDYLIPKRLGGANDFANLWPVPSTDPTTAAKARADAAVADAVCGGRAGIQAAHYALSSDWTTAVHALGLSG